MIYLITGLPASGKTLLAVTKIYEMLHPKPTFWQRIKGIKLKPIDRPIYSNINGLNIPNVNLINNDDRDTFDWRKLPDNSIIIIDEAQNYKIFSAGFGGNSDSLKDLTIHRHRNFDIYFITQHPDYLNKWVTKLVNSHYHLIRFWNRNISTLYEWSICRQNPTAKESKGLADSKTWFKHDKTIFSKYSSAVAHSIKSYIPRYVFVGLSMVLALFAYVYYGFSTVGNKYFTPTKSTKSVNNPSVSNVSASTVQPQIINNSLNKTSELKKDEKTIIENKELEPFIVGCMIFDGKAFSYLSNGKKVKIKISDCNEQMQEMPVRFPQHGVSPSINSNSLPVSSVLSASNDIRINPVPLFESKSRIAEQ